MRVERWAGYREHATEDNLHNFRVNAGKGGCTVFAEIIRRREGRNLMGLPWCATFVFAAIGRPDILGPAVPGSRVLAKRMRSAGYWRGRDYRPRRGDLVFCTNGSGRVDHVGIVLEADGETVRSIDGNTRDPEGVFAPGDGGVVAVNIRTRDSRQIVGYAKIGHLWTDAPEPGQTIDDRPKEGRQNDHGETLF